MRAQRAAGVPQAHPEASLDLDRRITAGWLRAAKEVVLSHARADGETEYAPSPLIVHVPVVPLGALSVTPRPSLRDAIRRGGRVDTIEDGTAPPIAQAAQAGGTTLFKDQAACPFRGFARRRLRSEPVETPRIGLDARDRGTLLHEMLAEVWRELGSRAGLLARTSPELRDLLRRACDTAVAQVKKKRGDALAGRFERLERERLAAIVEAWLEVERGRPEFEVLAVEEKRPLTLGGVTIEARLDRMDAVERGRAIIDYKTGECDVAAWLGARPDEPQLPMYALENIDVSVVAFGQVKVGKMGFRGIAREPGLLPGVGRVTEDRKKAAKEYRDWDHLVQRWREELESIGRGFAAGDARVDPKSGPKTCELCDQHTFCRVAEKAPFGVRKGDDGDE